LATATAGVFVTQQYRMLAWSNLGEMGEGVRNTSLITALGGTKVLLSSALADLAAVAIYVGIGHGSHDEALAAVVPLATAWPFVIGVAGGYIGTVMTRWPALSLRGGAVVTVKCLIIGLVLRYGVQREGTPFSFIAVTVLVLTALMIGWRLAVLAWSRRSSGSAGSAGSYAG
jgi:peptidoglycan/LPS O-acetylase OafA/YrhL